MAGGFVEKLAELQTSLQSMTALSDFKYIVSSPVTTVKLGDKLAAIMPDNPAGNLPLYRSTP
jgi:hypothetical protein